MKVTVEVEELSKQEYGSTDTLFYSAILPERVFIALSDKLLYANYVCSGKDSTFTLLIEAHLR